MKFFSLVIPVLAASLVGSILLGPAAAPVEQSAFDLNHQIVPQDDDDDEVAPTVRWIQPVANNETAVVKGETITLEVFAEDNQAVRKVTITRETQVFWWIQEEQIAEFRNPPYKVEYDTSGLRVGRHVLIAEARDRAGNRTRERIILERQETPQASPTPAFTETPVPPTQTPVPTGTKQPPTPIPTDAPPTQLPDTLAPQVNWVLPGPNESITQVDGQPVLVEFTASDNVDVASASIRWWNPGLNQYVTLAQFNRSPYRMELDSSRLDMGWNQIFAVARDASGNAATQRILLNRVEPGGDAGGSGGVQLFLPSIQR